MPLFKYKGFTTDGRSKEGAIEAQNSSDAANILKTQGVYITSIENDSSSKKAFFSFSKKSFKIEHFTRQLSILLASGVPIIDAIKVLAGQEGGHNKKTLIGIREKLEGGSSFSKALYDFPNIFPEVYVNMIEAGETGGKLPEVLENLASFLETSEELKARIKTASIYPVFMLVVGVVVLFFVFIYVVPKITKIFEDSERTLPFITTVLMEISSFLEHYWWALFIAIVVSIKGFRIIYKKKEEFFDSLLNRIPLFNSLYSARFMKTAGFLLESGVPILKTLKLSAQVMGNKFLESHVLESEKKVSEGAELSTCLSAFPPILRQIIQTGQKSGKLSEMLLKAAVNYEKEFNEQIKRYLNYLEPVMILVMGLIVGFIVFSVLIPIFELNQLIK